MDKADREQWGIREGDDVYGVDGGRFGTVRATKPGYLVVERGFFFPTDYYVPTEAVASYEDGAVHLIVTKDAALGLGWDAEPTATIDPVAGSHATGVGAGIPAEVVASVEVAHVSLHAEELTATTRPVVLGKVRIGKEVVEEERVIEVPVTEERLRVQRRSVEGPLEDGESHLKEGPVVEVPIRGEEVELRAQVRVAEEVEIAKEAVRRTEQVAGTVRREEVRIAERVDANVADARRDRSA